MIIQHFLKKNTSKNYAQKVYLEVLSKSKLFIKNNYFFIKKDFNNSFEIISIFLIFLLHNNKNNKVNKELIELSEYLIQTFISDLDESLRAIGIGDMSIGKYVKSYVKKFYFRLKNFDQLMISDDNIAVKEYLASLNFIENNEINKASIKFNQIQQEIMKLTKN